MYAFPDTDPCSAKRSFAWHVKHFERVRGSHTEPDKDTIRDIAQLVYYATAEYTVCTPPKETYKEEEGEEFYRAVGATVPSKSTGLGAYRCYKNIGEALGHNGIDYDQNRLNQLRQLLRVKVQMIGEGRAHAAPLKVFVKPEPHKMTKIRDGRFRLISGVALEDAMLDRILFGKLARNILAKQEPGPVMVGCSLFGSGGR